MAIDGAKDRGLAAMREDDVRSAEIEALAADRAGAKPVAAERTPKPLVGERPRASIRYRLNRR